MEQSVFEFIRDAQSDADDKLAQVMIDSPSLLPILHSLRVNGFYDYHCDIDGRVYRLQLNGGAFYRDGWEKPATPRMVNFDGKVDKPDHLWGTLMPNPVIKYPILRGHHLQNELIAMSDSVTRNPVDPLEWRLTRSLREYLRDINQKGVDPELHRFRRKPFNIPSNMVAYPMLAGKTTKADWITMMNPDCRRAVNRLYKLFGGDTAPDAEKLSVMLTYYNIGVPYGHMFRQDASKRWPVEVHLGQRTLEVFKTVYAKVLYNGFANASQDITPYVPSIKGDKSPGPDAYWPDGTHFSKTEASAWTLADWSGYEETSLVERRNNIIFKIEKVRDASMLERARFFLENCASYADPAIFIEAFKKGAVMKYFPVERRNQNDSVDPKQRTIKSRYWSFEQDGYLVSGYTNPSKVAAWTEGIAEEFNPALKVMRDADDQQLAPLRIRAANSANNASFAVIFIFLMKLWMNDVEDGVTGFPSIKHAAELADFYAQGPCGTLDTYDTTSNELVLGASLDYIVAHLPKELGDVITGLSFGVVPSDDISVTKGFNSGRPDTTVTTMISGDDRAVHLIAYKYYGVCDDDTTSRIATIYLSAKYLERDKLWIRLQPPAISFYTHYVFILATAVTDDLPLPDRTENPRDPKHPFCQRSDDLIAEYAERTNLNAGRYLTSDNVFGLHFTENSPPKEAKNLVDAKVNPQSNEPLKDAGLGDRLVVRFYLHYMNLSTDERRRQFRQWYWDNGWGDIESGIVYYCAMLLEMKAMHYAIPGIYEAESPKSRLLKKTGGLTDEAIFGSQKYPIEPFQRFFELFQSHFFNESSECRYYAQRSLNV